MIKHFNLNAMIKSHVGLFIDTFAEKNILSCTPMRNKIDTKVLHVSPLTH